MRVLFIGGTGMISSAAARGVELALLIRGLSKKHPVPRRAGAIYANMRGDAGAPAEDAWRTGI